VGLLLEARNGRLITLSAHTLIGRSSACVVVLEDPPPSAQPALIAWSGERWEVRDLGSLNGTWLNGRRLSAGERVPIATDSRIGFGGADVWMLANDRPAGPAARSTATSELVHSVSQILALPSADDPQATVFRRADGQWLVELGTHVHAVTDRDQLEIGSDCWTLFLPSELSPLPETAETGGSRLVIDELALRFAPSLDEEHVSVQVRTKTGKEYTLPQRSSHYMLLTLARARIADAHRGVIAEEQGWIYACDLADMLQYTAERLNIEIFRARAVFAKLGVADFAHLIERRTTSRQIRIGVREVQVIRGAPSEM
jgi:hypothetical protein